MRLMLELVILIVGVVLAMKLKGRLDDISRRLNASEMEIVGLRQALGEAGRRPGSPPAATPAARAPGEAPSPASTEPAIPPLAARSGPPTASVPTVPAASSPGSGSGHPALPPPASGPPPDTARLEERLGTRWAVYAGGLALALGGIFLVRYSIEAGLIGPGVRVLLGALFSAALVAAGEWFRRTDVKLGIDALPEAHIPSVLTAAGTIAAFATVYAAHALYGFVGPTAAFVLLGAVGVGGMLAAALHGPALAGLGLAGSLLTPLLVSSTSPSPWSVVLYLAAVAAAALLLARARGWLWLAATVVVGVVVWGLVLLSAHHPVLGLSSWVRAAMIHALIQMVLAAGFIAIEPHLVRADRDAEPDWIASGALAALAFLAVAVLAVAPFYSPWWLAFALAAIALLAVTAYVSAAVATAGVLAGLVAIAALLMWPGLSAPAPATLLAPALAGLLRLPESVSQYLAFAGGTSLAVAALAAARLGRGAELPAPTAALLALAATATPLLALVVAYLRVTQFDHSIPFAAAGVALAALFALAAERFDRGSEVALARRIAAGAFAAAAIAALSFALVAALSRGYLTVAFALAALGAALVSLLRDLPVLRYAVSALGLVVLARIAWDPRIMGASVGSWPILNWLLLGYGVPAAAFALSARLLSYRGDDLAVRISEALAIVFAALLAFFQIRHLVAGDPLARSSGHLEQGLLAMTSLAFSQVLMRLDLKRANPVFETASTAFAAIALMFVVLGLGFVQNPWLTDERIAGAGLFNSLVPAYLLPGLMALYVGRLSRGIKPDWYGDAAAGIALALVLAFVSFEVRHAFQGARIGFWRATASAELWAYTAAWLALAIAFLAYGLLRQSLPARIASAGLIALVAVKVVVLDFAGIDGLWRALSFICLGLVLVGIGLVYQRLVFAPARADTPSPTE
jgi:uncharacterized membrane protein